MDKNQNCALSRMRRLTSLLCFLLLAVWLPATEHCALEAAGVLAQTCPEGCAANSDAKIGCDTVEEGQYRSVDSTLKVPAPDLFVCVCQICLWQMQADATRELAVQSVPPLERPQDWITTWSFVRRAAPPSRAPTTLVA